MPDTEAIKEAISLKGHTNDLEFQSQDITLHCDNQSALHLMKNPMLYERSKHIDINLHFIRDIVGNKDVTVQKISTHKNPADIFTKSVTQEKIRLCLNLLKIEDC